MPINLVDSDLDIVEVVREAALANPNYKYNPKVGLRYEKSATNPLGCIIGFALSQMGISLEGLTGGVRDILVGPDKPTMRWLSLVQIYQDNFGHSWAEAVDRADLTE